MRRKGSTLSQVRQRIPEDVLGKARGMALALPIGPDVSHKVISDKAVEITASLRTRDPQEAKLRQSEVLAYLEGVWQSLRDGPQSLTHMQVVALAGEVYQDTVAKYEADPGPEGVWQHIARIHASVTAAGPEAQEKWFGLFVDQVLAARGLVVDRPTREKLLARVSDLMSIASERLLRNAKGDYTPDRTPESFPAWVNPKAKPEVKLGPAGTLTGLVDLWWTEAKAVGKSDSTFESYSTTFRQFSAFLKHNDAAKVTPEDVVAFKDYRLKTPNPKTGKPVSAKTVKGSDLTALKSVFDWAVDNRKLPMNPAAGVRIKMGKKTKVRERDFRADEIRAILKGADEVLEGKPKAKNQTELATRWVPWLCAYTGARVGELIQLRKEDIIQDQETGAWVLMITPEAGTVKGKERRDIPVHLHLLEKGFLEFVKAAAKGYLFMTIKPGSTFHGVWQSKKNRVAEFARQYVTDPNVAPNHGWRHTFKSRGFEAGIQEKVLDAICGHAPATVGREYGSATMKTKVDAMAIFPRYGI